MNKKSKKRITDKKKINVSKFKTVLREKGLNMTKLSVEMGFDRNYLSCSISQYDGISPFAITYLKNKYGIEYNEYKYVKEEIREDIQSAEVENSVEKTTDLSDDDKKYYLTIDKPDSVFAMTKDEFQKMISETIYQAVYSAMSHAWKDV